MSTFKEDAKLFKDIVAIEIDSLGKYLASQYPSLTADLLIHIQPTDTITSICEEWDLHVAIARRSGSKDPEKVIQNKRDKLIQNEKHRLTVSIQISLNSDVLIDKQSRSDLIMLVASVSDYIRSEASKTGAVEDIRRESISQSVMNLTDMEEDSHSNNWFSFHQFLFFDFT